MRKARHHPAHSLVVRRGAEGEVCGLVFRRPSGRVGRVLASPKKSKRAAAMSPSIADWNSLRMIAFVLGDRLDRVAPLDLHQARGLLHDHFIGGRLAFSTAGGVAALAGLEPRVYRRSAIADVVLPGRFGGLGLGHQTSPSRRRWPSRVANVSPVSSRTASPPVISCQRRMMASQ